MQLITERLQFNYAGNTVKKQYFSSA